MKKLVFLLSILFLLGTAACKRNDPSPQEEPENQTQNDDNNNDQDQILDAALTRIDLPFLAVAGQTFSISGRVQNFAEDTITSLEIKWQEDNGTEHTTTYNNLRLLRFDVFDFTHPDVYNASAGQHAIKVWISKVNGQDGDDRPANNLLVKNINVASQSVQHIVLYEEFTSSTCNPCYTFNTYYFNEDFLRRNRSKLNLIKYQMNWPNPGDPYYTAEGGERRAYYGINAVPSLMIDGENGRYFDTNELQADLDAHYTLPGVFTLNAYYLIDTTTQTVKVKVVGMPYVSGQFKVRIAVVERETTGNASTNGETRFFNVMMKMVPNPAGTTVDVTDGTEFTVRASASLANTHIEEMDDLEIVVFVQDDQTKFVYQSTTALEDPSQIDF